MPSAYYTQCIRWPNVQLFIPYKDANGHCILSTTSIKLISLQVFKKLANPGVFLIYFRLLKHLLQFLTTNKCEKCPSIIRCQDSNSQPLEHEPPPITLDRPDYSTLIRVLEPIV